MRLALALGRRHLGLTWPNPSVGAVLVAGPPGAERILAQGVTQPGGRPHAERVALAAAGAAARGATLYVTLEPCSHHGRTPPCADALVEAGVARVVSAMDDPDPRVAGHGHARLRAAGVAVTVGILEADAARDHEGHVRRVTEGRPAVLLKLARTRDGYAASGPGRLLITGPLANARVHLARAHADAILVGSGTVLADDPALTVRLPGLAERSPWRIVLDGRLRTPVTADLVRGAHRVPTLIIAGPTAPAAAEEALRQAGAETLRGPAGPDGRLDLTAALRLLGERGVTRILCEGGPTLGDALARADLVDSALILTGAREVGAGLPAIGPALADRLGGSLCRIAEGRLGADQFTSYARSSPCSPDSSPTSAR
ncbi:bifunctional diaminohydroxyphosphoribosylaminopyrimidine deaminase/5-amino-6-(5-phosphoribosylamino)uracil reductase RibD [Methylobacterium sp. JK268]